MSNKDCFIKATKDTQMLQIHVISKQSIIVEKKSVELHQHKQHINKMDYYIHTYTKYTTLIHEMRKFYTSNMSFGKPKMTKTMEKGSFKKIK